MQPAAPQERMERYIVWVARQLPQKVQDVGYVGFGRGLAGKELPRPGFKRHLQRRSLLGKAATTQSEIVYLS